GGAAEVGEDDADQLALVGHGRILRVPVPLTGLTRPAEALCRVSPPQRPHSSARQPEPAALVLNEPSCYHFRTFDPRLPLRVRPQTASNYGCQLGRGHGIGAASEERSRAARSASSRATRRTW